MMCETGIGDYDEKLTFTTFAEYGVKIPEHDYEFVIDQENYANSTRPTFDN